MHKTMPEQVLPALTVTLTLRLGRVKFSKHQSVWPYLQPPCASIHGCTSLSEANTDLALQVLSYIMDLFGFRYQLECSKEGREPKETTRKV